jgi:phosphatidate cytidylyltransferase
LEQQITTPNTTANYFLRIISGLIAIPLVVFCVLNQAPFFPLLWLALYALCLSEWKNLTKINTSIVKNLGYIYINVGCFYLLYLGQNQPRFLIALFALVWATDTFAFFTGRLLKGPKLAPSISPGKTISGSIGGIIGAVLVSDVLITYWDATILTYLTSTPLPFTAVIALSALSQAGDLLESYAKRKLHVKDSGSFLPGHGGILDRLDSVLAVSWALVIWEILR